MKLKNKIAGNIFIIGIIIILVISIFYYFWNQHGLVKEEKMIILDISKAVSQDIDKYISEITNTALTLSSSPIIINRLLESNINYEMLSDEKKEEKIENLKQQWAGTDDLNSPFIQKFLNNSVANYLKKQKSIIKGRYGEIFITNQYGIIIASTNKLTTLNHAHKYWWEASYFNGAGRIFLDDRGYDESVNGYVLGIVIPIIHDNKIIGVMKSNVNILAILEDVMKDYEELYKNSTIQIIRTGGLVVLKAGTDPLTIKVSDQLVNELEKRNSSSFTMKENNSMQLIGVSEIPVTKGSTSIGFGGSYESIDHIKGNVGESWHSVVSLDIDSIYKSTESTVRILIFSGIIFTVLTSLVALYIGKKITEPLVVLSEFSSKIGHGELDKKIKIKSNDEIGILANSFNEMVGNLDETMASRKKAEDKLKTLINTDELTKINNRRAISQFLHQNIENSKRYNEKLSLISLDIDCFKSMNDNYGHDFGDKILISFAKILSENVRTCDMAGRIGGDEFLIVLPLTNKKETYIFAERLRITISEYNFANIEKLTVSMGVSEFESNDSFDSLLKRADEGLYKSKNSGKNKVTVI